ncbi:hypothetical protein ACF0H5_020693 [Mactra antiquata]
MSSYTVVTVALVAFATAVFLRYANNILIPKPNITITENVKAEYDYVIIGGGTAGSVVAGRLAEDKTISVLVLESGPDFQDDLDLYMPTKWTELIGSKYDWHFPMEPQQHAFQGMKGNVYCWPRGHVLGGSGSINLLQYTRGSPYDFDEWESAGCQGWGYKDVLPYFLKSEDMSAKNLKDSKYHQTGGKISVSEVPPSKIALRILEAVKELGHEYGDYNGARQDVASPIQVNTRNGIRSSAAIEYLKNNGDNLHVSVKSHVAKIDIVDKTAIGVSYIKDNRKHYVRAKKEVILSAGSINSPQILMLSGIGPKNHLEEVGIPVVADLPVGKNLQDHQQILVCVRMKKPEAMTPAMRGSYASLIEYFVFGTGPLSYAGSDASLFFHLNENKGKSVYPDLQIVFLPFMLQDLQLNYEDHIAKEMFPADPNENGFCSGIALTHPRSRGTIKLQSKDPFDYPKVDPQYFADPRDVKDLVEGMKFWERMMKTDSFRDAEVDVESMKKEFCSQHKFTSEEYWECVIRHISITQFHPTSTCKMGPIDRATTVVGPDLKVKGISNLRVIDASIFPNVTSGNTNAPTVMVAEKGADMVRGVSK